MKSSWCKSSPVKAVAGRPVARVAIRRATGGCEAYTASKQAVRNQLRNWSDRDADALSEAEGSIRCTVTRGVSGSPESLAQGMLIKGLPVNPGELPASTHIWAQVAPNPKTPGLRRARVASVRSERPSSGVSCGQGKPEAQARADEQSYETIVPMKVENRRAPARGGHGIRWREGWNRSMDRRAATCTRPRTREGV